jgi:nucleotide-binding universal stress UspA family protein
MPIIISATDFSAAGNNAVAYACDLAAAQRAQVVVINSFIFPVMFSEIPLPPALLTEAQQDAENQMGKLVVSLQQKYGGLNITGKVIYGDILHTIDEITKDGLTPWLVVIGNNTDENTSWPDDILVDALKRLKYPVLAVPQGMAYKPIRKVCFAFDNKHNNNGQALAQLKDITTRLGAELFVLNAQVAGADGNNTNDIDETVKSILAPANPKFQVLQAANIDTAIQEYVATNNIDILVLLPRKHSFFEGLFHKSHTKAIAHHTHIPIIALHEEVA